MHRVHLVMLEEALIGETQGEVEEQTEEKEEMVAGMRISPIQDHLV